MLSRTITKLVFLPVIFLEYSFQSFCYLSFFTEKARSHTCLTFKKVGKVCVIGKSQSERDFLNRQVGGLQ